ncbi:MAG: hypothetical protein N4A36_01650 [Candidatus Gracilibacteria bacterium]|nr:hypothetical protein [Candidatus Gracilibacteria bacterium]
MKKIIFVLVFIVALLGAGAFCLFYNPAQKEQTFYSDAFEKSIFTSSAFAYFDNEVLAPISGAIKGAFLSSEFSEITSPETRGLKNAVLLSSYFAYRDEKPTDKFEAIDLLEDMENFINTDIQKYLDSSKDRKKALDNLLAISRKMDSRSIAILLDIQKQVEEKKTLLSDIQAKKNAAHNNFFASLNTYQSDNTEVYFQEFSLERQKEVIIRADLGLLMALDERFQYMIPKVQLYIQNIEKKYKNLILDAECSV